MSESQPDPYPAPTDDLACAEDALRVLQQVLHSISPDDLSKQTPCAEFDVAGLTDHMLNSISMIGGAVRAQPPPRDETDSVENQVITAARPTMTAWHRHGVDGIVRLGPNEAPAKVVVRILAIEFLVHAWDYAAATGQKIDVPEPLAEYVLGLAQKVITPEGRSTVGFADPIDVPASASALDRLIAFTGRTPVG